MTMNLERKKTNSHYDLCSKQKEIKNTSSKIMPLDAI